MRNFRICSAEAKGDTSELVRQNAEELERRLVLLKNREIDKEDFDYFVENQKRDFGPMSTASRHKRRNTPKN